MEARVGIEPTIAELQSTALPLCYRAFILSFNFLRFFHTLPVYDSFTEAYGYSCSEAAILGNVGNKSTTYQLLHSIAAKPA